MPLVVNPWKFPSGILLLLGVGILILFPSQVHADDDAVSTGTRVADFMTIGGEIRPRYEVWNNFGANAVTRDHNDMVFMRSRLNFDFDIADHVFSRIQIQDVRRWGDPASNASALTDAADISLREGFLELTDLAAGRFDVKIGRQAIIKGDERIFGDLDWHWLGRTHDAAIATWRQSENQKWDVIFIDVNDNDNTGLTASSKGGVDGDAFLWGLYGSLKLRPFTRFQPYWIYQDDDSSTLSALVPQAALTGQAGRGDFQIHTYGLLVSGELGDRWRWDAEGNAQSGSLGASRLNAYLLHGKLGYDLRMSHIGRVSAAYDIYSGDQSRTDLKLGTYQPIFPSYYAHTGLLGRFGMKNLNQIQLAAGGRFVGDWNWRFDWRHFLLASRQDDLYAANGTRFLATSAAGSRNVGDEYDLVLSWPWNKNVTFTTTGSLFSPGQAVRDSVRNAGGSPAQITSLNAQIEVKF